MVEFFMAAAIFGFAAVFAVPWVSSLLGGFVPTAYKSYLPSATAPGFTMAALINALVFGVVLAAILVLLQKAGIRAHTKGIEA
jgi:ABC-type transporter Mla maintaining outer membrane lipid asymmetry permease subunit MlaE